VTKAQFADPTSLLPNPWNTNRMSPDSEGKLDNSIRRFGCFKPIVVREIRVDDEGVALEIIGGEHRAQSAVRVGLDRVPIMNLGPISDKEAKEISLADNARYGADDTLELAKLLKDLGDLDEIQSYLPYADADLTSIFSASDIALDELELDDAFEGNKEKEPEPEIPAIKAAKTHTIMRFKVPLSDAERITEMVTRIQTAHGYTAGDQLTNAGDALVHLLLTSDQSGAEDD